MKGTEVVGARARTSRAKTVPPPINASTLTRTRLQRRLDALVDDDQGADLMLLSAPAGFGKTTLLSAWAPAVQDAGRPVAWCTLDDTDVSCFRVWSSVLAAVASSSAGMLARVAPLSAPHAAGDRDFLADLLDVLVESDLVLVLENLHEVNDPAALQDLNHLVGHLPAGAVAILSSRSDPAMPALQSARMSGQLDQLRAADLAFDRTELVDLCGDLSDEQLQAVWQWTEGWPALVRLMDLTIRSPEHPDFSLAARDGDLADYLFQETFRRQQEAVRSTLLLCSVPETVSVDLAVALTGRPSAGRVLEDVAQQSGLITSTTPPGSDESWYRMHPMLRAYLHGELTRHDLTAEHDAQRQCARWFLAAGHDLAAVKHAVASADDQLEDEVVRSAGPPLVNAGEAAPLVTALAGSRHRRRTEGVWTTVIRSASLLDAGQVPEAATQLHQLGPAPGGAAADGADSGDLSAAWMAADVHLRRRQGVAIDPAELRGPVHTRDADLRLMLAVQRAPALVQQGDAGAALAQLELGVDLARGLGRVAALIECLGHRAAAHAARSEFSSMLVSADEALGLAELHGWTNTARMSHPHLARAWGAHQALDDGLAAWHAGRAARLLDPAADPTLRIGVRVLTAELAFEQPGDQTRAADELHRVWAELGDLQVSPALVVSTAIIGARMSLLLRHEQRIPELLDLIGSRAGDCGELALVTAMHKEVTGRRREAREILAALREPRTPLVVPLSEVEVLVVSACLAQQDRDTFAAIETTRRALALAERLQGLRPLVHGGSVFHDLLRRGQGRWGAQEQLVDRVLEHAAGPPLPSVSLTSRELEVLRELPNLNTVEEIAGALFVSVNTVKTHMRSVYRKLDVTSRRAAVSEARRLGLL